MWMGGSRGRCFRGWGVRRPAPPGPHPNPPPQGEGIIGVMGLGIVGQFRWLGIVGRLGWLGIVGLMGDWGYGVGAYLMMGVIGIG